MPLSLVNELVSFLNFPIDRIQVCHCAMKSKMISYISLGLDRLKSVIPKY